MGLFSILHLECENSKEGEILGENDEIVTNNRILIEIRAI